MIRVCVCVCKSELIALIFFWIRILLYKTVDATTSSARLLFVNLAHHTNLWSACRCLCLMFDKNSIWRILKVPCGEQVHRQKKQLFLISLSRSLSIQWEKKLKKSTCVVVDLFFFLFIISPFVVVVSSKAIKCACSFAYLLSRFCWIRRFFLHETGQ